jgi:hypothetical protein
MARVKEDADAAGWEMIILSTPTAQRVRRHVGHALATRPDTSAEAKAAIRNELVASSGMRMEVLLTACSAFETASRGRLAGEWPECSWSM